MLHSQSVGRDLLVEVAWPPVEIPEGRRLPVVFALDGGFGLVGASATLLVASGAMAPAFVVSVGYPNPAASHLGPRNTDLLHVRRVDPQSGREVGGGGAAFEAFLVDELRPFLASRYPIDPGRSVLVGHSGAGLFAATILADRPQTFSAYVVGGVPANIDPTLLERLGARAAEGGARVFLFHTPQDVAGGLRSDEVAAVLAGPGSRLDVRTEVYERSHLVSYLAWAPDALPFLLPPSPPQASPPREGVAVPRETLDGYVGEYVIRPGLSLVLTRRDDTLLADIAGAGPVPLIAKSERSFCARGVDTRIDLVGPGHVRLRVRGVELDARAATPP